MEYNGGAVVAMAGKNCVAIACDQRLGMQALTVSTEFPKVFRVTDTTYIGLVGLATDVLTLYSKLILGTNSFASKPTCTNYKKTRKFHVTHLLIWCQVLCTPKDLDRTTWSP